MNKGSISGDGRLPVHFLPGRFYGVALELIELCDTGLDLGLVFEDRLEHLLEVALLLLDTAADVRSRAANMQAVRRTRRSCARLSD